MIIAFVNQKGGTGKSTSAIHLAYWLKERGSVLLIDADAQNSSSVWGETLQIPFQVISDPEDLFDNLPSLANEYDTIVVDGPGGISEVSKSILSRCDIALVPCQPSGLDLRSSNKTLRFIRQAQELRQGLPKAFLYLNRATKGSILLRESQQVLAELDIPLCQLLSIKDNAWLMLLDKTSLLFICRVLWLLPQHLSLNHYSMKSFLMWE